MEQTAKVTKEKTVETPQVQQNKPRKRFIGLKLLFWLFFLCCFSVGFIVVGIFVAREVLPKAHDWLVDHEFISGSTARNPIFDSNSNSNTKTESLSIPEVVKATSPSVVSIAVVSKNRLQEDGTKDADTIGTGFIVDSKGLIVTNQHVVRDTKAEYQVVTQDNKTYKPKNILRDEVNDIALIIIDATDLPALKIGDAERLDVGETVIAIGTPLGEFPGSVTVGIISGLGRSVTTGDGFWEAQKEYEGVLQTDAAINPGNSGGPLLNLYGEVIGVNFATTGGADNISFALPITVVTQKISEYRTYNKFRSPYLGVTYRMVTPQEAEFYAVPAGALVRGIAENSPAKSSGLHVGDIITKINDKKVSGSLATLLGKVSVGDQITVTVYRSDIKGTSETLTMKVTLVDRPAGE
ncbi:trypsin-like peptidase domain-containing protein [bacterium]|nr:trypsin-like peptidase domain-containing protein [bacterium]